MLRYLSLLTLLLLWSLPVWAQVSLDLDVSFDKETRQITGVAEYSWDEEISASDVEIRIPNWEDLYFENRNKDLKSENSYFKISRIEKKRMIAESIETLDKGIKIKFRTELDHGIVEYEKFTDIPIVLGAWYPRIVFPLKGVKERTRINWKTDVFIPHFSLLDKREGNKFYFSNLEVNGVHLPQHRSLSASPTLHAYYEHKVFEVLFNFSLKVKNFYNKLFQTEKNNFIFFETDLPIRGNLKGLVPIGLPRQKGMRDVLTKATRQIYWRTAESFSEQWFGGDIVLDLPETQEWFQYSLKRFFMLNFLDSPEFKEYRNYINNSYIPLVDVHLDTTELLQIANSILYLQNFERNLLEDKGKSNSREFSRGVIALWYAANMYGRSAFFEELRGFYRSHSGHTFTSVKHFLTKLSSQFPPEKQKEWKNLLNPWLESDDWWDPEIGGIKEFSAKITVEILQEDALQLPVLVEVEWEDGSKSYERSTYSATFSCPQAGCEINNVVLDPFLWGFDTDRFNNAKHGKSIQVLPSLSVRFPLDRWTLVWAAFPLKETGQPWSVGLSGGFAKAYHLVIPFSFSYSPSEDDFSANVSYTVPVRGGTVFQLGYQKEIIGSQSLSFSIDFLISKSYSYLTYINYLVGEDEEWNKGHLPLGVDVNLSTAFGWKFLGRLTYGEKFGVDLDAGGFRYLKFSILFSNLYILTQWMDLGVKIFSGRLLHKGDLPESVLFDPQNVSLAVRINDLEHAPYLGHELYGFAFDFGLPIPFLYSLKDTFLIANRRARIVGFYDIAWTRLIGQVEKNLQATGLALRIPLGGGNGGGRTLVLSNIKAQVVLGVDKGDGMTFEETSYIFGLTADF